MRRVIAAGVLAAAAAALGAIALYTSTTPKQEKVELLDPARVIILRTPGGMLEVATLSRSEEFAWSSRYTCPLIDCPTLFANTVSRVRVPVHYVYRLPLADKWELHPRQDHYELVVPGLQPASPVAFDTTQMQIESRKEGWVTPGKRANEHSLLRELGPELQKRAGQESYLKLVQPHAEKTVQEFAAKWMVEQKITIDKPVTVRFRYSP
jgi:hypothetical protein